MLNNRFWYNLFLKVKYINMFLKLFLNICFTEEAHSKDDGEGKVSLLTPTI